MSDLIPDLSAGESGPETIEELIQLAGEYLSPPQIEMLQKAFDISEEAHRGQIRRSGEPYISHPIGVAGILAQLKLDAATIATGLLHDTVEDTDLTLEDIETNFGPVVQHLVDGVTKISRMKFRNTHEKQGENIRKMIMAMGKDVRVVLVKLADRLHNMRTLNHMPYEKQMRIAQETLDIYAPLASRLGISRVKVELEDLSFRYAHPDQYYALAQKIAKKKKEREKYIEEVRSFLIEEIPLRTKMKFVVTGRPKHLFSIFKKMQAQNIDYEQVYDVLAFRVLVHSIPECYEVLGIVHSLWKPIPGRFKDFIAMPKNNSYQSLHTTVIGPSAERIEIQIRTHEMDLIAEEGIAAHWKYKEESRSSTDYIDSSTMDKFNWLREMVTLHQQTSNADEFLENIKTDLFDSEIYVFTPKGEVKEFPDGATPIDFAYSIHTDVGSRIVAARANGKMVSLKYKLKSGDAVEVITSKNQTPSKDWLKFCVTTRAKSKIRAFVKTEQRKRALVLGKELVEKRFRKHGMNYQKQFVGPVFDEFLVSQGCSSADDLLIKVGFGTITPKQILEVIAPDAKNSDLDPAEKDANFLQRAFRSAVNRTKKSSSLIQVDGLEDVLVRFSKCCGPIPGDPIQGFITLGRGISIHRADCEKTFELDPARRVDVTWSSSKQEAERVVTLRVLSHDIPGMLKNMSEVFGSHGVNIHNASAKSTKDHKAICLFDVSVRDTEHLSQVMLSLGKLKGIIGVSRMTHVG